MQFSGFAVSVRGASHEDSGTPCQDSARVLITDKLAVAAVSDGHGSEEALPQRLGQRDGGCVWLCARSRISANATGASGAVFLHDPREAARRIAGNIICGWNDEIAAHMRFSPLTPNERAIFEKYGGLQPEVMYGATLILAAADKDGVFGLQIGDGTFTLETVSGAEFPMPEDERLVGNLTTSLCDCDAINSFRSFWREGEMVSVTLSSDGLINSFLSSADLLNFAGRTARLSQQDIPALSVHLRERSVEGSRDDISVAVIRADR